MRIWLQSIAFAKTFSGELLWIKSFLGFEASCSLNNGQLAGYWPLVFWIDDRCHQSGLSKQHFRL